MRRSIRGALALLAFGFAGASVAQVSLMALDTPVTQNFDALPASGSATLSNNDTLPGFFFARSGTGTTIVASDGSSNAGNLYSFGVPNISDRALGSVGSGGAGAGNFFWGVRLQNNTGSTITSLDVSYVGEQWRNSAAAAQAIAFSYQVGSPTVTGSPAEFQAAGTPVTTLNFTSPITGGTAGALNGNAAANQTALSTTITGLNIPNGSEVMLRWADPDHTGSDHGLSIDSLSVTPRGNVVAPPGTSFAITNSVMLAEGTSTTTNFVFTVTKTGSDAGTVSFATADGPVGSTGAIAGEDYTTTSGQLIFPAGTTGTALSQTITVPVIGDAVVEGNETFTVTISTTAPATITAATGTGTIVNDDMAAGMACGAPATLISAVQGSGATTPLSGQTVQIEGIVVGDFQGATGLSGFFMQEEDNQSDGNAATSEGIFVFESTGTPANVSVNDRVRVMGMAMEKSTTSNGVTRLMTSIAGPTTTVCSTGELAPAISDLSLPFASADFAERFEGMRVRLPQNLFATSNFTLGRFGEVVLSSGDRLANPTQNNLPGAPAIAAQTANNLNKITLDDASAPQNRDPIAYPTGGLSALNTLRGGDRVMNVTGVLGDEFATYRIQPTEAVNFVAENLRTASPPLPNALGSFRVASFNVLNYFNGNGAGGGFPTARGANTAAEFARQRTKIIAALTAMRADVIGVIEMENDDFSATSALADLVNGLNMAAPNGTTYAYVIPAAADLTSSGTKIGTDEIKVGFIYRVETAMLVGGAKVLDTDVDARFIDTCNRPVLAQTFQQVGSPTKLTVAVNHFKSKGSPCAAINDIDTGDGQGPANRSRTMAAEALRDWLATDPTASGDPDFLIIGDLNAYAKEDPIRTLEAVGYVNLVQRDSAEPVVLSYPFNDQWGTLDYGLANPSLAAQVTMAVEWTINGAEPTSLDYNLEFKSPGQQTSLYNADPYRSSDHDPVVIEIAPCIPGELSFSSTPASTAEGSDLLVTVQRTGGSCGVVGVSYASSSGSAVQGADFTAASGTLSFSNGDDSEAFTVATTPDLLNEVDETFSLTLTNATGGATLAAAGASATRTILDDDALPTVAFAVASSSFAESASLVTVTVNLSTPSGRDVTVPFTVSGTATPGAGGDFTQGTPSPLVIPAGSTTATLNFTITDDATQEAAETIVLTIDTMVMNAATGSPATHTLTIVDNDVPAGDTTPDAFDFGTKTGQAPASLAVSDVRTPTGFSSAAQIVPGPGASYRINGGAWVKSNGSLQPGQTLQVRHTTSSASGEFTKTCVRVGGVKAFFTTQTGSPN